MKFNHSNCLNNTEKALQNQGFCHRSRPVRQPADGTVAMLSKKEHNELPSLNNLDFKSLSI